MYENSDTFSCQFRETLRPVVRETFLLYFLSLLLHAEIIGKPQKPIFIDQKRYLNF